MSRERGYWWVKVRTRHATETTDEIVWVDEDGGTDDLAYRGASLEAWGPYVGTEPPKGSEWE